MTIQQVLLASSGNLNWVQTSDALLHRSGANDEDKFTYIGASTDADEVILAKYTPLPSFSWVKKLSGVKFDSQISYDTNGYIYLAATVDPSANGRVIVKLNTSGAVVWSTKYTLLLDFYNIAVNSGGNVYFGGFIQTGGAPYKSYAAVFNSSGSLLNQIKIEDSRGYEARNIKTDSSGNFYMAGRYSKGSVRSYNAGFVAKFNSSASLVWIKEFYSSSQDFESQIGLAIDSSGNVYVSGGSSLTGGTPSFVMKFNSSGTIQWQKSAGNLGTLKDLVVTADNYLYATSYNDGNVLKMDTSGNGIYLNNLTPLSFCNIGSYGRDVYLYGQGSGSLSSRATSALLPADGTKTVGAIDSFYTYSAQSLTVTNTSFTIATPTPTITAITETTSSGGITVSDYVGSSVGPYYF
jgi:hypothetical protein